MRGDPSAGPRCALRFYGKLSSSPLGPMYVEYKSVLKLATPWGILYFAVNLEVEPAGASPKDMGRLLPVVIPLVLTTDTMLTDRAVETPALLIENYTVRSLDI